MEDIKDFDITQVPLHKIVLAVTSEPDYSMDRIYIADGYPEFEDYAVINGSHCSCYDFDETTWYATIYNRGEMDALMKGWLENGWGSEPIMARLWFETKR